jgi:ParB-like chromosome segregation protein Spo0J
MAKLPTPSKPGFNAGDSYNVKYIRIDKIVIDPEISDMFKPIDRVVDTICQDIIKNDFRKEEPVTLWALSGKLILVDGHQRYYGAKKAGKDEIPYIEKNFESREEAYLYTFARQAVRRNLTGAELLYAANLLLTKDRAKNGEGRHAKYYANILGVSEDMIYKAESVIKNASEEEIQKIKEGKSTITGTYKKNKQPREPKEQKEVEFTANDAQTLPGNISFLKGAVILLVDKKQTPAAELLINHYLKKKEKRGFYDLLPKTVSAQLPKLPLLTLCSSDEQ